MKSRSALFLWALLPVAAQAVTWSVGDVNGAPGLLKDGRPVEPCFFWQWTMEREDVEAFSAGGMRFFSQFVSGDHARNPWWKEDGRVDLTFQTTNLANVLKWNPSASFLPRLFYTPPKWWTEAHPEERCGFSLKTNTAAHASFASKRWRKEGIPLYGKAVRELDDRFGDSLMGIHVATGPWGEHFGWDGAEECNLGYGKVHTASDVSENMRRAFASFLRKKYGGDEVLLRRAFRDPRVTFETVRVPTLEERLAVDADGWRDPAKSRLVPDYFECHNAVTVDLISRFAKAVKDATRGRKLVAAFYGYTQDESWGIEADHRAPSALYRCPHVDILSAPHTYNRREPGGDGSMRQYLASAALHGKLFIDEADDRTYLELRKKDRAEKTVPGYIAADVEDSVHVLFREFGNAVTHGVGLWYMDIRRDNFRDPALVDACCRARKWSLKANSLPRGRHSAIAVVSNPESEFYMGYRGSVTNTVGTSLYHRQLPVFMRTGVPFDWYLIDDLDAVAASGAKVIVFLDCQYMNERHRAQVERLKSRGRTLVFFHAPGYVTEEGLSRKVMERVCGFRLKKAGKGPLAAKDCATGRVSGYADMQIGLFAPVAGDGVEPIATGVGCLSNEVVIARRDFGEWTGVFSAVTALSAAHVRRICRDAGVHVYTDSGAVFSANDSWAMVHTRHAGDVTVRFPGKVRRVTDIVSERVVGENVTSVTLPMGRFRTAVLMMEGVAKPPPYVRIAGFEKGEASEPKRFSRKEWSVSATNLFAVGGQSVCMAVRPHRQGFYSWPAVTVKVPEGMRDWRRFNKLQIDVAGLCDVAENVFVRLPGSDNQGLTRAFPLPVNGTARWTLDLLDCPKTVDISDVRAVEIFMTRPRAAAELYMDDFTLIAPNAPERPAAVYGKESLEVLSARRAAAAAALEAKRSRLRARLAAGMREADLKPGRLLTGSASTMLQVRPDATDGVGGVKGLSVRLARGEREGVQLLVTSSSGPLRGVRVEASGFTRGGGGTLAASCVSCDPVGYVKIGECGPYGTGDTVPTNAAPGYLRVVRKPVEGWFADPILPFLSRSGVDIPEGVLQSFWIRVSAPTNQPAGIYDGFLVVSADGVRTLRVPFSVRVNDFTLPGVPPIPLAVSFNPEVFIDWPYLTFEEKDVRRRARIDPKSPVNIWKRRRLEWGDFLADYFITFTSLYNGNFSAVQWDILSGLKEKGKLGHFNLGYWHPVYKDTPEEWRKWRINTLERLRNNYAEAKRRGLDDRAYIYGCDEAGTNLFPAIKRALSVIRKEFPSVPIATTTLDWTFGEESPLKEIDIFTPTTAHYDPEKAARARASGRKVWWYIACGPKPRWANMWIESAPIESRLLAGAMAQRMKPDGFLYYSVSTWNSPRPILSGPFTDWTARTWCGYNGDGAWTAVGPGGMPLPTVRLENFRDGVEDLAYAKALERMLSVRGGDDAWAKAAREALAVPVSVMETMENYTSDPDAVLAWRNRIADLLETGPK